MQALAWLLHVLGQTFESHGGVDQIAKHGLPDRRITGQIGIHGFGEQVLAESYIALRAGHNRFLEISSQRQVSLLIHL